MKGQPAECLILSRDFAALTFFFSYPCGSSIRQVTLLPLWHTSPTVSDIAEWQSQNSSLGPPGSKPHALYPQSWLGRETLGEIPEFSLLWTLSTLIRLIFTFLLPSGKGLFKNEPIWILTLLFYCMVSTVSNLILFLFVVQKDFDFLLSVSNCLTLNSLLLKIISKLRKKNNK